jgi:ribonuclease P protein component
MPTPSYAFGRKQRLSGRLAFAAVFDTATKFSRGPFTIYSKRNTLPFCRWGLSVPRRVGTAPRRNRVKRLLRESIRHLQHDISGGYDLVIVVRPHPTIPLTEYQKLVSGLLAKIQTHWAKIA